MLETGQTISRFFAARAIIAGAAFLAGAAARPAEADPRSAMAIEETALAVPRVSAPAWLDGVGLPQPLAPSEASQYRRIFALQAQGEFAQADLALAALHDQTLVGTVLAARYLAPSSHARPAELTAWLARHADLPDAQAIRARLPAGSLPGMLRSPPGQTASPNAALGFRTSSPARARAEEASYEAGLQAWRRSRFALAATDFAVAASSSMPTLRAAAAFWTARAELRLGRPAAWRPWMERAAAEPATLHGMLARRALGEKPFIPGPPPAIGIAELETLAGMPRGRRAFALLQIGDQNRAEAEFRHLWPAIQAHRVLAHALLQVSESVPLPALATDIAEALQGEGDIAAPPRLHPSGGFSFNPALVTALTRVESNFDSRANSNAGAHGLMQLTPVAVSAVAAHDRDLRDPAGNLRLGQRYLAYLAQPAVVGDDLLRVLAAWNAGPGAIARWPNAHETDPLVFLETIPVAETRRFLLLVLTYAANYAAQMGTEAPGLAALAAGAWPRLSDEFRASSRVDRLASLH